MENQRIMSLVYCVYNNYKRNTQNYIQNFLLKTGDFDDFGLIISIPK